MSGFSITVNGSPVVLSGGTITDNEITFTAASTIYPGDTVLASYDANVGDIQGETSPLASFTDQPVTNNSAATVSCYYGFNGFSQLAMSNDYRTGSRTLTSGTNFGLIASTATELMVDFTTGIKVVGFLADMPSLPAGNSTMQIGFTNSAQTLTTWRLEATTQYDEGYGAYFAGLNCGAGSSIYTPISSWPALLCAQFDAANSTATLFVNGVAVGSVSYTPLSRRMQMKETQYSISGGSIGLVVSGTIVTDAAEIGAGEYDAGATDICGTAIPT